MRQYERDTWYDAHGRIVFTTSKGLVGVGLPRKAGRNDAACTLDLSRRSPRKPADSAGRTCSPRTASPKCPTARSSSAPCWTTHCRAAPCAAPSNTSRHSAWPTAKLTTESPGRTLNLDRPRKPTTSLRESKLSDVDLKIEGGKVTKPRVVSVGTEVAAAFELIRGDYAGQIVQDNGQAEGPFVAFGFPGTPVEVGVRLNKTKLTIYARERTPLGALLSDAVPGLVVKDRYDTTTGSPVHSIKNGLVPYLQLSKAPVVRTEVTPDKLRCGAGRLSGQGGSGAGAGLPILPRRRQPSLLGRLRARVAR